MEQIFQKYRFAIIALIVAAIALSVSVVQVDETQQAVVIRGGNPDRTINSFDPNEDFGSTGAGLGLRIPFYERVQYIDKRILDLDMGERQVLTSDQQRLQVDAYARFRIFDPITMVRTAETEQVVGERLSQIFPSVLREELGRRTFASLLTAERGNAMTNIRSELDERARQYGAQILDVRIKRADLPEGTPLDAAFNRMRSDRQEEAETIRAQGRKNARIIEAEAQAEAARTYADAYGKDPKFYDFYRAMQSYRTTFAKGEGRGESAIILSPDNEYLRQVRGG